MLGCSPAVVTQATVGSSTGDVGSTGSGDGSTASAAASTGESTTTGGGATDGSTGSTGSTGTTGGAGGPCSPCLLDTDCGEAGIASCIIEDAADPTGFCAPACSDATDCDPGALCFPTDSAFSVCYPASGSCEPSDSTSTSSSTSTSGASSSTSTSSTSSSASSTSSGTTGASQVCGSKVGPDVTATCACPPGKSCGLNGCYNGWWCDTSSSRCGPPPTSGCVFGTASSSSSGTTGSHATSASSASSSSSSSSSTSTGTTGGVGPAGGTVDLMHFAVSGDTRPPACGDTANYPSAIIDNIADAYVGAGVQFALDLGDHMYVCNNSATVATAQMNLFMQATRRYAGQWFMTMGNHECMGGNSNSSCLAGSTNANFVAYLAALSPVSSKPYYQVEVHTRLGLAIFVFIADNAWDSVQSTWLTQVLTDADNRATYTIIAKHHPQADSSVAANSSIMQIIRNHKFALLLTGHTHSYSHQTADQGRDLILGNGGAPLVSAGTFNGYAVVDQLASGRLQVTVYDVSTHAQMDQWSVGPN